MLYQEKMVVLFNSATVLLKKVVKHKLILNLKYAIPFDNIRKWGTVELLNSYNVLKKDSNELNFLFGIGMEYFEFRDTQKEMQNFMKHKVSPIYKIGLEYKF